ncbi:uncharacterized protein LOC143874413 [Tasmannia lanceolata]|uniref:uncharacterized protein LOC143874413 n=1 Tax=Tasmannia lanceolata TaxID=3420 RepID=UPI004064639F
MARASLFHLLRAQTRLLTIRNPKTGLHPCRLARTWEHFSTVELPNNYAKYDSMNQGTQIRWASHAARGRSSENDSKISIGPCRTEEKNDDDGKDTGVVYYGPISSTIKKVKLLSLSTCCLSVSLGPIITFMTGPDMNVILKGAVASSVIFLSASTTAALHWFVSPYVHKLKWQPGSDTFDVEMLSWLATYIPKTIKFSDIRVPKTNRPFVTFKANDNFYFIDSEHCHNKALLARLTPKEPTHQSALKNV